MYRGCLLCPLYPLLLKYTFSIPEKSRFPRSAAEWNRWVTMKFLLFMPARKRRLGWRKTENPRRDRLGWFCYTVMLRYSCVTCYKWHSVEQVFWKLWTKRHSLSADEVIGCVYLYIDTWRVCQTRVYYSQIYDWKQFARHPFSLFRGIRLSPQTSKTSESTACLSLAERWTITDIRRLLNSMLTYSMLTNVPLMYNFFSFSTSIVLIVKTQMTGTPERELVKPVYF